MKFNEANSYPDFPHHNPYIVPPEIPTEIHQLPHGYSSGILYFQFERKALLTTISSTARAASLLPMLIMFLIILFEIKAYLFWYLLPMLESTSSLPDILLFTPSLLQNKYTLQLLIFIGLSLNLTISTILTIFTKPGEVVKELQLEAENIRESVFQVTISEKFLEKMKKFGNCERKRTMFPRFCRSCLMVKPDRSHHCSVCNKCVLKMDHHCPYVNNCIGLRNYKYFLNMVITGTAASLMITFTMWEGVRFTWESSNFSINRQVLIGIAYFGNIMLCVVLSAFLVFHFYLITNALTTIEFREKMAVKFDSSPYNVGCIGNFLIVFGRNPLKWLIPFGIYYLGTNLDEEKLSFKHNEAY